jgi:uncharacterized protein (DUF697 family)
VNPPSLLQIVERLERLASRLPSKIRKAVLSELTPLKQLFLQQRPPRFLFAGSSAMPLKQVIAALFASDHSTGTSDVPVRTRHWHDVSLPDRGTISILDARGADASAAIHIQDELKYHAADIIFFLDDGEVGAGPERQIIEILLPSSTTGGASSQANLVPSPLQSAPGSNAAAPRPFLAVLRLVPASHDPAVELTKGFEVELLDAESRQLMSILARELPNQARMEMIRISRNREAQHEVAQLLVKSTTAVCAAIGAQPIPLADLPILTSLQVMMISGIMYVSGRERSLRAATQFVGALGANVGAAMLLREGTRAILKFFPGWGNVVCGLVAGSGTYAIGRAATVFFIDGVSLKDARRTYLSSRKKRPRLALPAHE